MSKKVKKTKCGARPTKTPKECFQIGMGVGIVIANKPTRKNLMMKGKGQLEGIASRQYKIKNARAKTKATLIKEILKADKLKSSKKSNK